jgi:hypothetical protein
MRKQRGVVEVDTFKLYDRVYQIYLNKKTGEFTIEISPEHAVSGKDLETVRKEATAFIESLHKLEFKPVIYIEHSHDFGTLKPSDDRLDFEYKRYFRAVDRTGKAIWRRFQEEGDIPEDDSDNNWLDALEGKPGEVMFEPSGSSGDKTVILDYTPERWKALRRISKAMMVLNRRLEEIVKPKVIETFLDDITKRGLSGLLAGPAPYAKGKEKKG